MNSTNNEYPPHKAENYITKTYRVNKFTWVAVIVSIFIFLGFITLCQLSDVPKWVRLFSYACFPLIFLGALDTALTFVKLDENHLTFAKGLFNKHKISRNDIQKVTWERESGVSIQLHDGAWVKLPIVGTSSHGLSNGVQAWLKRKVISSVQPSPKTSISDT